MNLFRSAISQHSACTDVVEIVQVLGSVVAHLIGIQLLKSLHTLALQSYIIIIGGSDNSHFRFRISQSLALTLSELVTLFVDARKSLDSLFATFVKLTILRTALTEAHLLDIAHQQLYLIVGKHNSFCQQTIGLGIIHGDQRNKSQMGKCLSTSSLITLRKAQGLTGIQRCRIDIAVMIGIRKRI